MYRPCRAVGSKHKASSTPSARYVLKSGYVTKMGQVSFVAIEPIIRASIWLFNGLICLMLSIASQKLEDSLLGALQ
jgi:hypothetical protein